MENWTVEQELERYRAEKETRKDSSTEYYNKWQADRFQEVESEAMKTRLNLLKKGLVNF